MSHIFISYSRRDLDFAQKIVDALAANDLDTWIDWKSIPKGEDWEQEIYRGIEEADAFLFLISPDSVASLMCNKEIDHAVKNGKRILPIFIANVDNSGIYAVTEKFLHTEQKEEINRRNFIICRQEKDDFDKAMGEVQKTIHTDYEWLKYHTRLQVKALEWERTQDTSRLLRGKELREAKEQLVRSHQEPLPTELQRYYLLNSERIEERQRRRVIYGLGLGLVFVTIFAVLAWQQRNIAISETNAKATALVNEENARATAQAEKVRAEEQARISLSRQLSAQSISLISAQRDFDLTLLLALESNYLVEDKNMLEAKDALRQAMNFAPQRTIRMEGDIDSTALHPDKPIVAAISRSTVFLFELGTDEKVLLRDSPVQKVLFSPDGSRLLAGVGGNYAYLWHGTTYEQIKTLDHSEAIISIKFSNDSRIIITQGKTSLKVWDATNGSLIWKLQTSVLSAYAISNTNKLLVTLREDGLMEVWDSFDGTKISSFQHKNTVTDFAFSADDQFIITSNQDQKIYFWNVHDFTITKIFEPTKPITNLVVDPSGKYIAAVYRSFPENQGEFWIWDIQQKSIKVHKTYSDVITAFCFDRTGSHFAVSDWSGIVGIFNLVLGTELNFHSRAPVSILLFNLDDSLLLISNFDGVTNIIDKETGTEQAKLRDADFLYDIFINQHNLAVSVSSVRTIRFWDINSFKIPKTLEIKGSATKILFNPGNSQQFVLGTGRGLVQLWQIGENQNRLEYSHLSPIKDIQFSSSGEYFASLDANGILYLVSVSNIRKSNPKRFENVGDFSFSPDGKWFLTTSNNQLTINNLEPSISPVVVNFSGNNHRLIFSPDGLYLLITGKTEALVYLFDDLLQSRSSEPEPVIKFQPNEFVPPVFSYDTKWLAAVDSNNILSIWDLQKRKQIISLQHTGSIEKMDFSLDGSFLTTGSCQDGVGVWNIQSWMPIITPREDGLCLYRYSIDPTGKKVLSTYSDGNVRIMDISTKNTAIISYHKLIDPSFNIIASFSPSGTRVATSGDDGIVRIIAVDSGQTLENIYAGDMIGDVLFSPDGKYIIASSRNEKIYIWESEINNLKDKACKILSRNLTREEWSRFMGNDIPYKTTCSSLPPGQ